MAMPESVVDWKWSCARDFLPFDLDSLAVESGALTRRRGVRGGEALVRALLLCGLPKTSLVRASAMAKEAGIAQLNSVALFKRLCAGESLLRELFEHTLKFAAGPAEQWGEYRVLAADATVLCGPGSKGTDQKLHVVYDLGRCLPVQVDVTDAKGGETLRRYDCLGCGDLVLGDRGYGHANGLACALKAGSRILVRFEFSNLRLLDDQGEKIWPEQAQAALGNSSCLEFCAYLPNWVGPLRVIGARNDKGKPVWLLTDLTPEELPADKARSLYGRRWQIELFFKRLKSILDLDALATRDGPSAKAWIWAKLLLASLAVLLAHERFSPWGRPFYERPAQPVGDVRAGADGAWQSFANSGPQAQTRQAQRKEKNEVQEGQAILPLEA
jgi:hypothetical protein